MVLILMVGIFAQEGLLWRVTDTGIYSPLHQSQVAMAADGHVFLLDKGENHIKAYGPKGDFLGKFCRKGHGPGEMTFPNRIFVFGDHVYLHDFGNGTVICFDLAGNFLSQAKVPPELSWFVKVSRGWVYGTWRLQMNANDPGGLYWSDEAFEHAVLMLDLRRIGTTPASARTANLDQQIPFNPAVDRPLLVADDAGSRVFLLHRGTPFTISVFNPLTRKSTGEIKKDWEQLPFNEEWGKQALADMSGGSQQGMRLKFKPDFPDFFPYAQFMHFLDGNLYLQMWTADSAKSQRLVILNPAGEEQTSLIPARDFGRIGGISGNHVLVFTYDSKAEVAGLALCTKKYLPTFLQANPIAESAGVGSVAFQ